MRLLLLLPLFLFCPTLSAQDRVLSQDHIDRSRVENPERFENQRQRELDEMIDEEEIQEEEERLQNEDYRLEEQEDIQREEMRRRAEQDQSSQPTARTIQVECKCPETQNQENVSFVEGVPSQSVFPPGSVFFVAPEPAPIAEVQAEEADEEREQKLPPGFSSDSYRSIPEEYPPLE